MSDDKSKGDDGVAKYHKNNEKEEITMKPNKSNQATDLNKNYGSDYFSDENVKKPKMMKNGLFDRPFLSWIRILSVTAVWWSFVIGFFCLCFFFMNLIIYGTDNDIQPYFVRDFKKYPGILNQPSLNIMCLDPEEKKESCNTTKLVIRVNKIFNFKPDPYAKDERPSELGDKLTNLGVTEGLLENQIYVTCEGRKEEDRSNLQGMKLSRDDPGDTAGMSVDEFPWTAEKESWPKVILDLSDTKIVKDSYKDAVIMECRAWAKNIEREDRNVDKKTPRGGVLAIFCFNNGKIVNTEDCE